MSELMKKIMNDPHDLVPETPYLAAKQEWDNRIGTSVVQAYNWRKIAFVLAGISFVLVVGLIISNMQPKYLPYIVEVGESQVTNVAKAAVLQYHPKNAQIKHYLLKFVEKIRGVSIDHEVNKKWLHEAYSFLTPKTANKLDQYFMSSENSMLHKVKEQQSVFVIVNAFTAVSNNVYELQWVEETHDLSGKLLAKEKFVGFVNIKVATPTNEKSILQNPLGIWITDFSWSKVMTDE